MSSIFRAPHDDSTTESTENSEIEVSNEWANHNDGTNKRTIAHTSMALTRLTGSNSQLPNTQPILSPTFFHFSLIEGLFTIKGQCRTQAARFLNAGRRQEDHFAEHHSKVDFLAQHLFSEIKKELQKAGVIPDQFVGQDLSEIRRSYLSSLDEVLHNIATKQTEDLNQSAFNIAISNPFNSTFNHPEAAINNNLFASPFTSSRALELQLIKMAHVTGDIASRLRSLPNLSIGETMYKTHYKEVCLLGKGGFGKVYKAIHKLDGRVYAIKKVVMRVEGYNDPEAKAKEMVSEIKALAQLNHRNIVRYHTSWAEKQPAKLPGDSSSESEDSDAPEASVRDLMKVMRAGPSRAERYVEKSVRQESRHARQESRMLGNTESVVVFERSGSLVTPGGHGLLAKKSFFRSPNSPEDSSDESDSESSLDKETSAEDIPRGTEIINSSAVYDFVLYIQMSLHQMNLDDFLWPEQQEEALAKHCFHAIPTARILLAVLDGVEYIHRHKIVHRDLKPSNIMLSVSQDPSSLLDGSVNISSCPDCREKQTDEIYIVPHIVDFGLVADIPDTDVPDLLLSLEAASPSADITTSRNPHVTRTVTPSPTSSIPIMVNTPATPDKEATSELAVASICLSSSSPSGFSSFQPGTRFYMAPKTKLICPKIDVYSLGVIAFEMVWKFGTRFERIDVLDKLMKRGIFPEEFEDHPMAQGIRCMLRKEREHRWGCAEVRQWLNSIIAQKIE